MGSISVCLDGKASKSGLSDYVHKFLIRNPFYMTAVGFEPGQ